MSSLQNELFESKKLGAKYVTQYLSATEEALVGNHISSSVALVQIKINDIKALMGNIPDASEGQKMMIHSLNLISQNLGTMSEILTKTDPKFATFTSEITNQRKLIVKELRKHV